MEHIPTSWRHCILCRKAYDADNSLPCTGPLDNGRPVFKDKTQENEEFAAKIKTLAIHPKGR